MIFRAFLYSDLSQIEENLENVFDKSANIYQKIN